MPTHTQDRGLYINLNQLFTYGTLWRNAKTTKNKLLNESRYQDECSWVNPSSSRHRHLTVLVFHIRCKAGGTLPESFRAIYQTNKKKRLIYLNIWTPITFFKYSYFQLKRLSGRDRTCFLCGDNKSVKYLLINFCFKKFSSKQVFRSLLVTRRLSI